MWLPEFDSRNFVGVCQIYQQMALDLRRIRGGWADIYPRERASILGLVGWEDSTQAGVDFGGRTLRTSGFYSFE